MANLRTLEDIYSLNETDLHGNDVPLSNYKGKVLIIVNVTGKDKNAEKQFRQLQLIGSQFKAKGLALLLFPCCQFGEQESIEELLVYIKKQGFEFENIFQKVEVNGSKTPNLYKYMKIKKAGNLGGFISASFTLFIVNRKGQVVERLNPGYNLSYLTEKISHYASLQ